MTSPVFTVYDALAGSAPVYRVRRNASSLYSISMEWLCGGKTGTFIFDFDVDEVTIPAIGSGITLAYLKTYGECKPSFGRATAVCPGTNTAPALKAGQISRALEAPIKRAVSSAWKRDFYSDLVAGFVISENGFDAIGKPCFKSSLASGRAQFENAEVGLYSDPVTDKTNPFQIAIGKRILVPEKLPKPITATGGTLSKICTYSSPLVSTETLPMFGYGRFEYAFALRSPQAGMWPAGWSICTPHERWPDCEMDTVEISGSLPYQTHWWPGADGPLDEGQYADVTNLIAGFSYGDIHTYWSEWTPTQMRWGIDGTLFFSAPNSYTLANPSDPADPNRLYMMLQIALGGAGGDCSQGAYPIAPSEHRSGQPCMLVDHIAHYATPI